MGLQISPGLQPFINTLIGAAEDFIERETERFFEPPDPDVDELRTYDGNGATRLVVDDLRSVTSLIVDGDAQVEGLDFLLYPLNSLAEFRPFEWIELIQPETEILNQNPRTGTGIRFIFEEGQGTVEINGKWNWAEVPDGIKVAAFKIASSFIKENVGDEDVKEVTQSRLGDFSVTYVKIKDIADRVGVTEMLKTFTREGKSPVKGLGATGVIGGIVQVS